MLRNVWNVEVNVLIESIRVTDWRKIGVNLTWKQACNLRRENRPFLTRAIRANNSVEPTCSTCGAFGGHWLSCKSATASAVSAHTNR